MPKINLTDIVNSILNEGGKYLGADTPLSNLNVSLKDFEKVETVTGPNHQSKAVALAKKIAREEGVDTYTVPGNIIDFRRQETDVMKRKS